MYVIFKSTIKIYIKFGKTINIQDSKLNVIFSSEIQSFIIRLKLSFSDNFITIHYYRKINNNFKLQEQGISTLQDVELLQQTPELEIYKLPSCQ